jgi:hypothetical protein
MAAHDASIRPHQDQTHDHFGAYRRNLGTEGLSRLCYGLHSAQGMYIGRLDWLKTARASPGGALVGPGPTGPKAAVGNFAGCRPPWPDVQPPSCTLILMRHT